MTTELIKLKSELRKKGDRAKAENIRKFFKNSQSDIFLGVTAARIRNLAKDFYDLPLQDVLKLMKSNTHDERSIAHAILCLKFRNGDETRQSKLFKFYIKNRNCIRDWDGVDDSAPYIVGSYLLNRDKEILYKLARSKRIWDRRIAIVSTLHFVRCKNVVDALKIAEILLNDDEDLIHKATGWILREVGKRNITALKKFLKKHYKIMPRTMLRYAIERFPAEERNKYLLKSRETRY